MVLFNLRYQKWFPNFAEAFDFLYNSNLKYRCCEFSSLNIRYRSYYNIINHMKDINCENLMVLLFHIWVSLLTWVCHKARNRDSLHNLCSMTVEHSFYLFHSIEVILIDIIKVENENLKFEKEKEFFEIYLNWQDTVVHRKCFCWHIRTCLLCLEKEFLSYIVRVRKYQ